MVSHISKNCMRLFKSSVGDLHCNELHTDEYFLVIEMLNFLVYVTELGNEFKSENG